jgi:hypothetical protein
MSETNRENVKCCMCGIDVYKENTFIPSECLLKHGDKISHRICVNCWWNPESGFALENELHRCPGCVKKLPFIEHKKKAHIIIDLTDD